jgi:hypothetical protein
MSKTKKAKPVGNEYLLITILYFISSGITLSMILNYSYGRGGIFIISSGALCFFWLVKVIIDFVKKRFVSALQYILLMCILVSIALKLFFYYHHVLFGVVAISALLITLFITRRNLNKTRLYTQFIPFLVFGMTCMAIPNIIYHSVLNGRMKVFSEASPYTLEDFKATPPPNSKVYKNLISTDIRYKINNFGEYPDGLVIVGMRPKESFIVEIDTVMNLQSLNDFVKIKEVGARKIRKMFAEQQVDQVHIVDSIKAIIRTSREMQNYYQEEVFDKKNDYLQKTLHYKIKIHLEELDEYK